MKPQSFAKSPGYFNAKNTARILCWCASLAFCIPLASAADGTWNGANGATWNTTATNWTGVTGAPWDSGNGTSNTANFTSTSGNATVSGTVFVNGISYTAASGSFAIESGTISVGGTTPSISVNTSRTLTINSTLAGSTAWSKAGAGTLVLGGANSYDGVTTINAGTLTISNNTALGSAVGGTTIASGASLNLQGNIAVAEALTHNGGTSGYLRNVSGNNAWNGDITIGAASSRIRSDAGLLTIGGNITMTQAPIFEGAGNISITGVVSGSNFVMGGAMSGTLFLSGNNTYTGSTNVNAGTLSVSSINNQSTIGVFGNNTAQIYLGASTNGTLQYTGSGVTTDRRIRVGGLGAASDTGGAIIRNDGSGALVFNWSGQFNQATASTTANRTLTLGGTNTDLNTIQAAIVDNTASTGLVGLIKADAGTWVLSGSNTYSGATSINNGTLVFRNTNARSASTAVTVAATGTVGLGVGAASGDYSDANVAALFNSSLSGFTLNVASGVALDTTAGNFTQSTALTAARSLTKLGNNTLTLNGSNTYSGDTTISAGTLALGGSGSLGGGAYSGNIANSGTFTLNTTATQTLSGILSGNGALTKSNTGTLTLSGNNTYAGSTTISAGVLNIQHANALGSTSGNTTVSSGGALQLQGGITVDAEALSLTGNGVSTDGALRNISGSNTYGGAITLAGATRINSDAGLLTLSGAIGGNTQNLTIGGAGNTTISNAIGTTTGTLTKDGAGTLTLSGANTYDGATTVSVGVLNIQNNTALGTTVGSTTVSSGAALQLQGSITVGAEALSLTGNGVSTDGALRNISGSNTYGGAITLAGATRINSDAGLLTLSGAIGGNTQNLTIGGTGNTTISNAIGTTTGTLTKDGAGTLTLSGANTFTGGATINAGTLQLGNAGALNSTAGSENAISFGASSTGSLSLNGNSIVIRSLNSNATPGTPVVQNANAAAAILTVGNSANAASSYAGVIQDGTGGGALSLTKAGTGTLTLSGNNTYAGSTTVSAGVLNIQNNTALGTTAGGTTVASGAALQLQGDITVTGEALSLSGGGIGGANGALRNISGNNTWGGDITISASSTRIRSDAGVLTIGGNITMTQAPIFEGAGNISITGIVSGSNSLTMGANMAGGVLTLSGNNTYTGGTLVNAGTLSVSSINNQSTIGVFGNNTAQVYLGGSSTNGTLLYTGTGVTTDRRIRVGNGVNDTGNAIIRNDGSGALVFNWIGQFNQATGSTTANRTLTLGGTNTALNTIQGAIVDNTASTGLVGLTKADAGTWVLSGSNTYTGATTINAGTLQIGAGGASGNLSASSTITNNGTLVFNRSGNMTQGTNFANSISGTGNLTQAGSGTLFLGGTNSYTGLTTISAGNLSISTITALGSTSGINLANATALIYTGGAGNLTRNITVTSGTGTIRNSGTGLLTLSGALTKNSTTLTLAGGGNGITVEGVISGSANNSDLVIDGGTTTLTNANNFYNGPTLIINGGTLNANVAGALPTSTLSAVTINGSSTLALGASQSVASLSGTSGSSVNLNANTLTINGSATTTYSGGISGTGNLVKNGSGTQTLAGATIFTGNTTVNSGTLKADAANALGGTTNIDVNGGSLLVAVANAVNSNANINLSGGTLAVSGNFNQNVGALTLSADSVIDLNGFSGILRFSNLSWANTSPNAKLAIWNWSGTPQYGPPVNDWQNPSHVVFGNNANLTAENLAKISFYSGGNNSGFIGNAFSQSFSESGFVGHEIIAVPEPETVITAVILLLGVTFYQIRLARHGQGLLHGFKPFCRRILPPRFNLKNLES